MLKNLQGCSPLNPASLQHSKPKNTLSCIMSNNRHSTLLCPLATLKVTVQVISIPPLRPTLCVKGHSVRLYSALLSRRLSSCDVRVRQGEGGEWLSFTTEGPVAGQLPPALTSLNGSRLIVSCWQPSSCCPLSEPVNTRTSFSDNTGIMC